MDRLPIEKDALLTQLLRFLVLIGGIAYLPSMAASLVSRLYLIAVVDTLVYLLIIHIAFSRRVSSRWKIFVLVYCSFTVGVVVLFMTGPDGAGYIWFIAAIVLSALFANKALLTIQLVLACLALALYSFALHAGWLSHNYTVLSLVVIASNLLLVALLLAFLTYKMLKTMEAAYREQTALSKRLTGELQESLRMQTELTRVLEHKDILMRELHHRVKNNLQSVSSLMNLERNEFEAGSRGATEHPLLDSMQRHVHVLAAVNDLFLENSHAQQLVAHRLLTAISHYCVESDAAAPFVCPVGSGAEQVRLLPQNASIVGLAVAEILTLLRPRFRFCLMDMARTDGRCWLLCGNFRPAGEDASSGPDLGSSARSGGFSADAAELERLLAQNSVLMHFFTAPQVVADGDSNLRIVLDVTDYVLN